MKNYALVISFGVTAS